MYKKFNKKNILIVSICYLPNIGGVETHINDLITELIARNWKVSLLTYQPINTPVLGSWVEKSKNSLIVRLPIIRGLFYKLVDKPILEFLFLFPIQFAALPFIILLTNPDVINAQGIVSAFTSAFWSKVFGKRFVISIQNIYNFPAKGLYRYIAKLILNSSNKILVQSDDSRKEIVNLGIPNNKITIFTHWEDTNKFKPINKKIAKERLGLKDKFIVSFFGRLVDVKGIPELLKAILLINKKITFLIYGEGPLKNDVLKVTNKFNNVFYRGIVAPDMLPLNYSAADIVIVPSTHEEGFGRVVIESLLCGTPVIVSNRGQLPKIINSKVGRIIDVNKNNIAKTVNYLYKNKRELLYLSKNARQFAVKRYSRKNVESIMKTYE
jgi:glycosyltransferase involved in cell wall biosynthesis